jgi:lichenan operon transcriptional antiterminator
MISKKHSMMIKYLAEKDEYVTAEELSQQLVVSVRTIKRYIQDLNYYFSKYGTEIFATKGIGYKLKGPAKEIRRISEEAAEYLAGFQMDDSTEGRITKILCAFFNRSYINAEELSEILNLSIASTNKLIASVKSILKEYDLKIIAKPFYGSKIVGEEIKVRELILHYAIKSDENNLLEVRLDTVSKREIKEIEKMITEELHLGNIILADKDFTILLTRVLISVARVRKNCTVSENAFNENYRLHNYDAIKTIMNKIGRRLDVDIDKNEVLYVSLSSGIIIYDYNTRRKLTIDTKDVVNIFVKEALREISMVTDLDFTEDSDFINALVMHLKIFMNRCKAGISAKNPLLKQIKAKFPMETNLATIMAKKLKEEWNVTLDEDEIGFITMHFGAAFERRRSANGKKVCIICHYGIGTSQLLAEKLKQRISDINIVGTYPVRYLDIALKADIDFIVSTVKLDNKDFRVPILYIENVFSDEIVNELHQVFQEKEERQRIFKETFNKEAFFRIKAETPEDAIKSVGRAMKDKGFIDEDVIAMVLEREKMSSTDIGNLVAIPHTILEGSYKSIIGVGMLEKPIIWNKEEVQLIFMVCFNKKESYNFPMFKYLYHFIQDEGEVRRVIKIFSFNKLMEILDVK